VSDFTLCPLHIYSSCSLALQPCVGLGLLRSFVTVYFSGMGLLAQPPTWRTRDNSSSGPYPLTCLAWVTLPGAYAPASIAAPVIGAHKPPLHDKVVILEETITYIGGHNNMLCL
jgi:hypothetical protein